MFQELVNEDMEFDESQYDPEYTGQNESKKEMTRLYEDNTF
jgi:hypothetical protein